MHIGRKLIGCVARRSVSITREEAMRVDRFVMRVGRGVAARRLGVGLDTIDAAIEQGALMPATKARLLERLTAAEQVAA